MPKKRIEVVERAAAELRAQLHTEGASNIVSSERLMATLSIDVQNCPSSDVMLGGAYSRLQLWQWENPAIGGMIWLRNDLDPETRRFAIAHELGHYALHRGEGINVHTPCDQHAIDQQADPDALRVEERNVQEYSPRVRRELEANAFAAELLAPRAETRNVFTSDQAAGVARLAHRFGISRTLAERRLIDAILAPTRPTNHTDTPTASAPAKPADLLARLDEGQQEAARAPGPALVVAGPGTGKTATLVGRVAYLVEEQQIPPERVLALTFSNRAADEMRERLEQSGLPGERMPIMTIHAFAATLLREYASHVPHAPDEVELTPEFHILDEANSYLLMEELLDELPLRHYRSLGNPTSPLHMLRKDFSQARDELLTPADYHALVDQMHEARAPEHAPDEPADAAPTTTANGKRRKPDETQPPDNTFTEQQVAKARERAGGYAVWDRALRRRGLVDFGGLVQRAVELLRANHGVLAEVRSRYPQMLVDEFQDTNRAAAELLMLVAGAAGSGLWVVGDQNQSIYRFRGASPRNLPRLVERYPHVRVLRLQRCYRSTPAIVRLGSAMAARMAELAPETGATGNSATAGSPDNLPDNLPDTLAALREALEPRALQPVRADGAHPAIQHAEEFASGAHERVGLAATIKRFHALGYHYSDQAILCRTHKQVHQIATVLAQQGIPVSQLGDFFERPEIKDALMLLHLAAGPDARGILRAQSLLAAVGYPPATGAELAATARYLASRRLGLPGALRHRDTLGQIATLSQTTRNGLAALGDVAADLRHNALIGLRLATFLLRPGGYAWRLARIADGLDAPQADGPLPAMESPGQAQQALAALGELVRLAWRFDVRWVNEPEFQARLIRAVSPRRAVRPIAPDTLQGAPGADVAPVAVPEPHTAPVLPAEKVSVVACFLHYLHALRATDAVPPIPAGDEDAVYALTLHQSKGLEFPVVLLPGLARGQFPASKHPGEEVCPPGFRASDTPGERDAEERCLFYVGMTRARDVVAFTRAKSYNKTSSGAPQAAERSSLLALLHDAPEWANAEALLSGDDYNRLQAIATAFEEQADSESEDEDSDEPDAGTATATAITPDAMSAAAKPTFDLHELEQYLSCPLQYKYARTYKLLDPAENAVYRFHRFIRRSAHELRDVLRENPSAGWAEAEARLQPLWETTGPAGHAYETFYWQAAEAIVREEWQAITAPAGTVQSDKVALAEEMVAHLRSCDVRVTADRVLDSVAHAGAADVPATVLVRLHTGRPASKHKEDLALPLYYLAHQQAHPGVPVQIVLAYTGSSLSDDKVDRDASGDSAGAYDPRNQENVTEKARNDAQRYLDARPRARLNKLDRAALGIIAGQFAPRPNERLCEACAYCYVCPSDPENAADTGARKPIETAP
ncbi:MAG: UvrD-helicase domain-containing protein [Nitrososphaerota archaeon]